MFKEADLNILVSNILSENHYKHCRLCLKDLSDSDYVRFEDCVSLDSHKAFRPLSEVLNELFGQEICQEIPGVDAVCSKCVENALECSVFLQESKKSINVLHKIFDNLSEALSIKVEDNSDHPLYIIVGEDKSKVMMVDKREHKDLNKKCFNKQSKWVNVECENCKEVFTSPHLLSEHQEASLKCLDPGCDKYICSKNGLKDHHDRAHNTYVCEVCGKSCYGLDKLESHEKKHTSTKFQCPKCAKVYLTQSSFVKHIELCLAEKLDPHPYRSKYEKKYFCEKCGKGYSTPGGLRVHERFEHGNAKPHICYQCGKKFTAPSYLKIHMVKHTGEKNFNCNLCKKSFVSKEALLYHTRRHTGEKPFSCNLCTEKFVNASARAEHIKFKHTGPTLTCDICERKFFTSSFLKLHKKRHYDPASKLFMGRSLIPPNVPGDQNIRMKIEIKEDS